MGKSYGFLIIKKRRCVGQKFHKAAIEVNSATTTCNFSLHYFSIFWTTLHKVHRELLQLAIANTLWTIFISKMEIFFHLGRCLGSSINLISVRKRNKKYGSVKYLPKYAAFQIYFVHCVYWCNFDIVLGICNTKPRRNGKTWKTVTSDLRQTFKWISNCL